AGGIGVLVANNVGGVAGMPDDAALPATITIPSLMIGQADGQTVKELLLSGVVTAHLKRSSGPIRDGALDTTIVAHEWGHYLHHRLAACRSLQCRATSEGWGDFVALMTVLRPEDDLQGTYAIGTYATASLADAYFGIRRAPYSTDFAKNALTFRHIQHEEPLPTSSPMRAIAGGNATVHNAGELWALMLWDGYVRLIAAHGYETARRAMSDYLVAGLEITPADATYTEARDAILLAAAAISAEDAALLAQGFAARGAGACAVSPPRDSETFVGVVEDFSVSSGRLEIGAITVDDDVVDCDADGVLDAGETGTLRIDVVNGALGTLDGTTMTVTTGTPGVTIVGGTRSLEPLAGYASRTERFEIRMDPTISARTTIDLSVALTDPGACVTTATATASVYAAYDLSANATTIDDVESAQTTWTLTGTGAEETWAREWIIDHGFAWRGLDQPFLSDTQLVSPPLSVGTDPFVVSFSHAFEYEFDGTYWDGGVIEISTDDGATWADVTTLGVVPGYTGTITDVAGNPLANRLAYGDRNPSHPARDTVTLDFGAQLAG
ncbi:MAG: M36 family metallopeptidase, partial [Polyangiaceae bacterium]|nr:M36 family metallopeptidase [Polyangiaceae bacterium]